MESYFAQINLTQQNINFVAFRVVMCYNLDKIKCPGRLTTLIPFTNIHSCFPCIVLRHSGGKYENHL